MKKFLNAQKAQRLDELLFTKYNHSVTQLMELAGQAVAMAFMKIQPDKESKILVMAGPGNNGGDGLVAARHLTYFGYNDIKVVYPKASKREPMPDLVKQLENS